MASSLRGNLLRMLLPSVAALLVVGAVGVYFVSLEPASEAYDQALANIGLDLGDRIKESNGVYTFDLPVIAERMLRSDPHDSIYYSVRTPGGETLAGDPGLPPIPDSHQPANGVVAYDGVYRGSEVRLVALLVPCSGRICTVQVAETTNKRRNLARTIVLSSLVPQLLLVLFTLAIVWFGVKRGLAPLEDLSDDIRARSARDLRPIDLGHAPREAQPLVGALNQLFGQVAESSRNQQRFLANAAHQLRTPLAGLQAHAELALSRAGPGARSAELEQVHAATIRTARLANQLLAMARAEPGGYRSEVPSTVSLRAMVEDTADEWVHRALARDIDLGFELTDAQVSGDALLLREAFLNLVHNALEYTPAGGRVTARTGVRNGHAYLEVEDDGPGIPPMERGQVMERFYRIPGTAGAGSGLGLAIVREIALAHRAEVEIGSGDGGKGCKVELRFRHG